MEVAQGVDLHGFTAREISEWLSFGYPIPDLLTGVLVEHSMYAAEPTFYRFTYQTAGHFYQTFGVTKEAILARLVPANYLPIGVI